VSLGCTESFALPCSKDGFAVRLFFCKKVFKFVYRFIIGADSKTQAGYAFA
jgi:hypothetical protein